MLFLPSTPGFIISPPEEASSEGSQTMFSIVLETVTVFAMVSIAVAKHHQQEKLGEQKVLFHLALKHYNLSSKEVR